MSNNIRIFIIAGEASGDSLGASLMKSLHEISDKPITIEGIGGEKMIAAGLNSIFDMKDISLMGFAEILPHIFKLKRRIKETIEAIEKFNPDIAVTIDSPGFCYRVVKGVEERGQIASTKFVHYVAPTVWAYKPERAAKTASLYDRLLTLLPFEPPYFTKEGLDTHFVGHPIALKQKPTDESIKRALKKYNLDDGNPLLAVFIGSRSGEIKRMHPIFQEVIKSISQTRKINIFLPTTITMKDEIKEITHNWEIKPRIVSDEEDKSFLLHESHAALAKSGTVALDIANAGVPMITAHKVNPISAAIVRRMIICKYVNLINIMNDELIVEEFLQEDCTAVKLLPSLIKLFDNEEIRDKQKKAMAQTMLSLKPAEKHIAAKMVLEIL